MPIDTTMQPLEGRDVAFLPCSPQHTPTSCSRGEDGESVGSVSTGGWGIRMGAADACLICAGFKREESPEIYI